MTKELSIMANEAIDFTIRERGTNMLTHSRAAAVVRVPQDSTATVLRATFVDENGDALDLSGATGSKYFHASTQAGVQVTYQGAATFTTDGSDGKVQFALTSTEVGTIRTLRCEFEVQGYSGGNLVGEMFLLKIINRAAVAS
jgi:hypothetical protein